jgi:hypothetical protein
LLLLLAGLLPATLLLPALAGARGVLLLLAGLLIRVVHGKTPRLAGASLRCHSQRPAMKKVAPQ